MLQASRVLLNGTTSASPSGQPVATCALECTRLANLSARDRLGEELLPPPSATCTSFANSNAVGADDVDGLQRRPPLFAPEQVLQPLRLSDAAADPPPLPLRDPLTPSAASLGRPLPPADVGIVSTPPFPFPSMNANAGVNGGAPSKRKLSRLYERFKDKFRYQRIRLKPKSTSRRGSSSAILAKAHEQRRSSSGECLASAEEEVSAATPQHSSGNCNLSPSEADALQHFDKVVDSLGAEPSGSRSATGAATTPTSPHTLNRHHNASKSSFSSALRASDSQQHQQQPEQSHSVPPAAPSSAGAERKERRSKSLLLRSAQQLFASSSARLKRALSQNVSDESRGSKQRGAKGVKAKRNSISQSVERAAAAPLEVSSTWPKCHKYQQQPESHYLNLVERGGGGALCNGEAATPSEPQPLRPMPNARRRPTIPSEYIAPRALETQVSQQPSPPFQEPLAAVAQFLPPAHNYQQKQRPNLPLGTMLPPEARHYATVRCVPRWPPVTPPTYPVGWFAPVPAPHADLYSAHCCCSYPASAAAAAGGAPAPFVPTVPPVGWGEQLVLQAPEHFVSSPSAHAPRPSGPADVTATRHTIGLERIERFEQFEPHNPTNATPDNQFAPDRAVEEALDRATTIEARYRSASGPAPAAHSAYASSTIDPPQPQRSCASASTAAASTARPKTAGLADRMSPDERVNFSSAHAVAESRSRASLPSSPSSTARGVGPPTGRCSHIQAFVFLPGNLLVRHESIIHYEYTFVYITCYKFRFLKVSDFVPQGAKLYSFLSKE